MTEQAKINDTDLPWEDDPFQVLWEDADYKYCPWWAHYHAFTPEGDGYWLRKRPQMKDDAWWTTGWAKPSGYEIDPTKLVWHQSLRPRPSSERTVWDVEPQKYEIVLTVTVPMGPTWGTDDLIDEMLKDGASLAEIKARILELKDEDSLTLVDDDGFWSVNIKGLPTETT